MRGVKPLLILALASTLVPAAELRVGIVGTDTSHVPAFTALLNDPNHKDHLPGARVVAAFKGGSPDIPESANRVDKFAEEIRTRYGVEIVPGIPALCSKVDVVLLESVDGRPHLEQARQIIAAGKPLFIDKPLASTLADAREIARLAKAAGVPWFSSSAVRFGQGLAALKIPSLDGVMAWGPGPIESHHQLDLSWYGIHTVEILYTLMGRGCEEVACVSTRDADVITGRWKDSRTGVIRLIRPYSKFGAVVFSPKEIVQSPPELYSGYKDLVREILQFFVTKKPPVDEAETLEMFAFMDAAQRSKEAGGKPVRLQ